MNENKYLRSLSLEIISVVHLATPFFIFFIGWLQWWVAISMLLTFGYGFWHTLKYFSKNTKTNILQDIGLSCWSLPINNYIRCATVMLVLLFWVLLSGSGQYFMQTGDYDKHNAILNDLVTFSWPVAYSDIAGGNNLYYLVFYL
ncbi:MAG: hypothetical protein HQK53_06005, partial [Oligoflexia bacterium]|nr:hypothetical protein [Oligoflexia bacterium]